MQDRIKVQKSMCGPLNSTLVNGRMNHNLQDVDKAYWVYQKVISGTNVTFGQ